MRVNLFAFLLLFTGSVFAETETLKEWNFNTDGQQEGWTGINHLKDVNVKGGLFHAKAAGHDPFIVLESLDLSDI